MRRRSVLLTGSLLALAAALGLTVALTSQSPAARPHPPATAATAGGARYTGAYVYATDRPGRRNPGNGFSRPEVLPDPGLVPGHRQRIHLPVYRRQHVRGPGRVWLDGSRQPQIRRNDGHRMLDER